MVQQIEQERKTGVRAHIYKSQVTNLFEDGGLELSMPMESGKLVLLPIGTRFEFVFYAADGLYQSVGLVEERYKSNNMYMLRVSLKSPLCKFQRREYSRMSCAINMAYYGITQQQALKTPQDECIQLIQQPEVESTRREGEIVDISGGGVRFMTDAENKNDGYILIGLRLGSGGQEKTYYIPAHILTSAIVPGSPGRFENRAEFIIKDRFVREEIMRFIFDEERRNKSSRPV